MKLGEYVIIRVGESPFSELFEPHNLERRRPFRARYFMEHLIALRHGF
jgi:hypothetical protein